MAEPGVFDELSSRMSQGKRPDSGIHNSVELNVDESEQKVKRANADELADSGQESADQMDSSTNTASTKKKEGFFKSFKKIFKKKKTKKKTDESTGIQEQYKARSETDVLSTPNNDEPANKFQRLHSDASSLSPKRSKPLLNDLIGTKDEDDDEQKKKNSLKEAQQYIRSSLRKLKSKKGERSDADSTGDAREIQSDVAGDRDRSITPASYRQPSFDDEFFSKSLSQEEGDFNQPPSAAVKFGEITTTPQIENALAKDRIRVAPQNRRKPSRYRSGNAPQKPARSASSFSFKEDSFLTKIDEDSDNFHTSTSRHNSNASQYQSNVSRNNSNVSSDLESFSRSNSESIHRSSIDASNTGTQSNDHIPRALLNKHSFSTADDDEPRKQRSMAQRSYSTNSRENVNRSKPPTKPPRSAHTSNQSLNNDDAPVKQLSLGELRNRLFYSGSFDEKSKISKETSNQNVDERKKSNSSEKRFSYGENNCSTENKRFSSGSSKIYSTEKIYNGDESSNDIKRDSYGPMFRLTNSRTSLTNSRTSLTNSRTSLSNGEKIPEKRKSVSLKDERGKEELFFSKTDHSTNNMLAFALTSPRQDRKEIDQSSPITRSKSYSEKLENKYIHKENVTSNSSKSVGHINQMTQKSPPVIRQKPASPRKLRKSPPRESSEKPPEFHRISLRNVPKQEDYMNGGQEVQTTIKHDTSSETLGLRNVNLNDTTYVQGKITPSQENLYNSKRFEENDDEEKTLSFESSSLYKVDLSSSVDEKEKLPRHSIGVENYDENRPKPEIKRHSLKRVDAADQTLSSQQTRPEFKRNSLKDPDERPPLSIDVKKMDVSDERQDRPPRPLVKNRPTVHAPPSKSFSFQSNDVVVRSKSMGSADQKRLMEKNETTKESKSSEPEWVKLARLKQKNEEVIIDNAQQSPKKSFELQNEKRPISPPTKPKPKVNPRPIISPKPEVSPRPLVAKKPQMTTSTNISPQTKITRVGNGNSVISKDQCIVCGKKAFPMERIDVEKRSLHKNCAKCFECHRKLTIGAIFVRKENVYCSQHK